MPFLDSKAVPREAAHTLPAPSTPARTSQLNTPHSSHPWAFVHIIPYVWALLQTHSASLLAK